MANSPSLLQGKNKVRRVKTIYDCQADNDDELTFIEGEVIVVTGEEDQEWWVRTRPVPSLAVPSDVGCTRGALPALLGAVPCARDPALLVGPICPCLTCQSSCGSGNSRGMRFNHGHTRGILHIFPVQTQSPGKHVA